MSEAIIRYIDADPGQQYWRINRAGIVLSRKALDRYIDLCGNDSVITMRGAFYGVVACQWPSRNPIYTMFDEVKV